MNIESLISEVSLIIIKLPLVISSTFQLPEIVFGQHLCSLASGRTTRCGVIVIFHSGVTPCIYLLLHLQEVLVGHERLIIICFGFVPGRFSHYDLIKVLFCSVHSSLLAIIINPFSFFAVVIVVSFAHFVSIFLLFQLLLRASNCHLSIRLAVITFSAFHVSSAGKGGPLDALRSIFLLLHD